MLASPHRFTATPATSAGYSLEPRSAQRPVVLDGVLPGEGSVKLASRPSIVLASTARAVHDGQAAWAASEKALADSAERFRFDTAAAAPNRVPREYWLSRQTCPIALYGAAGAFGPRAATLLAGMESRDLALLGRIGPAEVLLGRNLISARVLFTR